jgi:hypothetical protein
LKNIKIYHRLPNGKFEKELKVSENKYYNKVLTDKRIGNSHTGKKVLRVSDGKEYKLITQCRLDNDLHKQKVISLLKQGIEFKLI